MPTVLIPPPYRGTTAGKASLQVEAQSVREALRAVEQPHPGFESFIYDGDGTLHRFVKLFKNGDPVAQESLDADLSAADELEVVAAIAGGGR